MPRSSSDSAFFAPTPLRRVTSISARSRSVFATTAGYAADVTVPRFLFLDRLRDRLLHREQIRIQRLAAVMPLRRHVGPVLGQPLGDAAGVTGPRAVAFDD